MEIFFILFLLSFSCDSGFGIPKSATTKNDGIFLFPTFQPTFQPGYLDRILFSFLYILCLEYILIDNNTYFLITNKISALSLHHVFSLSVGKAVSVKPSLR